MKQTSWVSYQLHSSSDGKEWFWEGDFNTYPEAEEGRKGPWKGKPPKRTRIVAVVTHVVSVRKRK